MSWSSTDALARLDAAIEERHLLKHPFYQAWQAGQLNRATFQLYAAQYYRHVEAFPRQLRSLAKRSDEGLREIVLENLAEEENPARPHPKLWRDFAAAVGVSEDTLRFCPSLPGTLDLVDTFQDICSKRTPGEAVAALYAYESQVPEIAAAKVEGLQRFYGVVQPEALAYFTVHEEADKAHRAAWRGWLEANLSQEEEGCALSTAKDALNALWGVLDGVHQAPSCTQ
jgi:pyrroloquinoline-quinone synthase